MRMRKPRLLLTNKTLGFGQKGIEVVIFLYLLGKPLLDTLKLDCFVITARPPKHDAITNDKEYHGQAEQYNVADSKSNKD